MRSSVGMLSAGLALVGAAAARPLDPQERVLITEALAVWTTVGDDVWPGWSDIPMRLVFVTEDSEFGLGFSDPLEGAQPTDSLGSMAVSVRPRTFAPGLAASFFVEGAPAVIIGTPEALETGPSVWVAKAVHEMYHVLQYTRGSPAKVASLEIGTEDDPSWQLDYPFPYESEAVRQSLHALGYCLFQAMTAETESDRRYAAGTAEEARAVLRALLTHETGDDTAFRYARFQAHSEGVAFWTEREIVRRAAAGYEPSAEFLALPGAVSFAALWEDSYRDSPFLVKHLGRAVRTRTLFYHLGFGLASTLERLDPTWQERYFEPDVWVDGMLARSTRAVCPSDTGS